MRSEPRCAGERISHAEIWAEGTPVPVPKGRTSLVWPRVCRKSIVIGAHRARHREA